MKNAAPKDEHREKHNYMHACTAGRTGTVDTGQRTGD